MSGLSMGEKQYWSNRIRCIMNEQKEKAYAEAGTSEQEIEEEAKRRVRAEAGVEEDLKELAKLREASDEILHSISSKWREYANKVGYDGWIGSDGLGSHITDYRKAEKMKVIALECGVEDVLNKNIALKQELEDAIMLATSNSKLAKFVTAVLDNHGVPDTHGLRALIDIE